MVSCMTILSDIINLDDQQLPINRGAKKRERECVCDYFLAASCHPHCFALELRASSVKSVMTA